MYEHFSVLQQRILRLTFTLLAVSGYVSTAGAESANAVNDNITFDTEVLKERGIDPKIAELFRHRSRFCPVNLRLC